MPIIISSPNSGVRLTHTAQARSTVTISLAHLARASTLTPSVRLTHAAVTQASRPARLEHVASAGIGASMPTVVRPGRRARTLNLNSSKGGVISAQYTHSGTRESLNLTVYGVAAPTALLDLSVSDSEGGSLQVQLDGDLFQYERRQTPTGTVTTLHGENRAASRLGSARLAELIPWKLSPTPLPDRRVPCAARLPPQETGVSGVIVSAFKAVGMTLSYPKGDPFASLTYKEGLREYSTLGKTPDQVFSDTLGQIGWIYVVRGPSAVALPPNDGLWVTPLRADDLAADLSVRGEATNTPSLVTLTGADLLLDQPDLITLAADAPDLSSLQRELYPDIDWYVTTPTEGGETIKGFRKTGGQMTFTNELTRSDVTVKETVDGTQRTRTFSRVVTGYTSTQTSYDPLCKDAMTSQRTVKRSYGYDLKTTTHSAIFSGPGWGGGYEAGDALADETQTIFQSFSPEGYLQSKVTTTTKLATLQQQGADGPLADRGPLQAREYTTQILSETFQPLGGKWLRLWSLSGGQQLPLYDTESGDAVRLASRGGTFNNGQEELDQAPAQVTCPDPCASRKVAYRQVVRRTLTDGREGQEVTRSLPFVDQGTALDAYADAIVASLAPSTSTDATLSTVLDLRPGTKLNGSAVGIVQTYSLDAAAGMATVKLGVRQLALTSSSEAGEPAGDGPWRDMVLWRLPGGVVVNHLKGIVNGTPKFDKIFVRTTGANLPSPGDELEWRNDTRFGPTATGNYGN